MSIHTKNGNISQKSRKHRTSKMLQKEKKRSKLLSIHTTIKVPLNSFLFFILIQVHQIFSLNFFPQNHENYKAVNQSPSPIGYKMDTKILKKPRTVNKQIVLRHIKNPDH